MRRLQGSVRDDYARFVRGSLREPARLRRIV